jgi:hypothetical protein
MKLHDGFRLKNILSLLIFIIGIVFIIISLNKKQISSKIKPQLPSLYISKNTIRRFDTKEIIQLKGVTTMTFTYDNLSTEALIFRLEKAKTWGINLLGIFINPFQIQNRWQELDKIIEWAKNNKIYIYLMPALNIHDKNHSLSNQINLLDEVSEIFGIRYTKYSHILYGFWAEPRGIPWIAWISVMNSSVKKLRKNNDKAIVLVTGIQFGRLFSTKESLPFTNAIFDIHDYPWANKEEAISLKMKNPYGILWNNIYDDYPVLIGEFGGVYREDFGSDEDLSYIQFILNEVNSKKLNYSAYTIDSEGELGLMNWETNIPTNKGRLILDDLKKFPPTNFN